MIHAKMRMSLGYLCCPVPQEFSDRVQIHAGHHQSTGEGMAIAMPRIVFESSSLYSAEEPATGTLGVRKYEVSVLVKFSNFTSTEVSIRFFSQSFEC